MFAISIINSKPLQTHSASSVLLLINKHYYTKSLGTTRCSSLVLFPFWKNGKTAEGRVVMSPQRICSRITKNLAGVTGKLGVTVFKSVFSESQMVKNLPAMQETQVPSLVWEDPLEQGMATQSSILAWRIPCAEEPGRLQSMESQSWTQPSH